MSDKIRMSDVFLGKTTLEKAISCSDLLLKDGTCGYEEEYLAIIFDHAKAKAITTAINSHDTMQDKIAQLEEDKAELIGALEKSCNRKTIDFVRCGIGANYSGEFMEKQLEEVRDPMVEAYEVLDKHKVDI